MGAGGTKLLRISPSARGQLQSHTRELHLTRDRYTDAEIVELANLMKPIVPGELPPCGRELLSRAGRTKRDGHALLRRLDVRFITITVIRLAQLAARPDALRDPPSPSPPRQSEKRLSRRRHGLRPSAGRAGSRL